MTGGQIFTYGVDDGVFDVQKITTTALNGVDINFHVSRDDGYWGDWWNLPFAAPKGSTLTLGVYSGATGYPFAAAGIPSMHVGGNGNGCDRIAGNFVVRQLEYGPGNAVTKFWVTFDQKCEGWMPPLTGEFRWNADVPVEISGPHIVNVRVGDLLSFDVTATATNGESVALSASQIPSGATTQFVTPEHLQVSWNPTAAQVGIYYLLTSATNISGQRDVLYTRVTVRMPVPANDASTNATMVTQLPFIDGANTSEATTGDEPSSCNTAKQTVWYAFVPATNMTVEASTSGSDFTGEMTIFANTVSLSSFVTCASGFTRLRLEGGHTYFFQVGTAPFEDGSNLVFSITKSANEIPENDEITNALPILTLPFTARINTTVATVHNDPVCMTGERTVWYSYSSAVDQTVQANTLGSEFQGIISVFKGSIGHLSAVSCGIDRVQFRAQAEGTYLIQVGSRYQDHGSNLVFTIQTSTDVREFGIYRGNYYLQRRANSNGRYLGSVFSAWTEEAVGGRVSFVNLTLPSRQNVSVPSQSDSIFSLSQAFRTKTSLNHKFPFGPYTFEIGAVNDGTNSFNLDFARISPPSAAHVVNWKAAQLITNNKDFTLVWKPLKKPSVHDQIYVEIWDEYRQHVIFSSPAIGTTNALPGTATSFVIPANTLQSKASYFGSIAFVRHVVVDEMSYPSAVGYVSTFSLLEFPLQMR